MSKASHSSRLHRASAVATQNWFLDEVAHVSWGRINKACLEGTVTVGGSREKKHRRHLHPSLLSATTELGLIFFLPNDFSLITNGHKVNFLSVSYRQIHPQGPLRKCLDIKAKGGKKFKYIREKINCSLNLWKF